MRALATIIIGMTAGICAAAYAAGVPGHPASVAGVGGRVKAAWPGIAGMNRKRLARGPGRPTIEAHPERFSTELSATFSIARGKTIANLVCRLNRSAWMKCGAWVRFERLSTGGQRFAARNVDGRGRRSPPAVFRWRIVRPRRFSVAAESPGIGIVYPGGPAAPVPVRIDNPNQVRILVTSLQASVSSDPHGCASSKNLALEASSASPSHPVRVPAHGSVRLPSQGVAAPSIRMLDQPFNQDACQGARFPLEFTGRARG